ncbi:hypothetical protein R6Q59_026581 [Mikania micrantha]
MKQRGTCRRLEPQIHGAGDAHVYPGEEGHGIWMRIPYMAAAVTLLSEKPLYAYTWTNYNNTGQPFNENMSEKRFLIFSRLLIRSFDFDILVVGSKLLLLEVSTMEIVKKAHKEATLCVYQDKLQNHGVSIQQTCTGEKVWMLYLAAAVNLTSLAEISAIFKLKLLLLEVSTMDIVKKVHKEATLGVHQDKLQNHGVSIQQKCTGEKMMKELMIFNELMLVLFLRIWVSIFLIWLQWRAELLYYTERRSATATNGLSNSPSNLHKVDPDAAIINKPSSSSSLYNIHSNLHTISTGDLRPPEIRSSIGDRSTGPFTSGILVH